MEQLSGNVLYPLQVPHSPSHWPASPPDLLVWICRAALLQLEKEENLKILPLLFNVFSMYSDCFCCLAGCPKLL
uniref:Uncharacterized protein n=1 Tax=Anguilla anguilla TaxID=7936 RepID=A0A0E9RCA1_ANGAN